MLKTNSGDAIFYKIGAHFYFFFPDYLTCFQCREDTLDKGIKINEIKNHHDNNESNN